MLGLLVLLLAVPLVTAVVGLREPRWYPSIDDAQTELRVRDVWSADPPLTGLGGRIGVFGPDQGSHPGPLSFWSLSVFYRLFGASSWALQAASASLHLIAIGLTLWLARSRGGVGLLLGAAAAIAVLAQAYGAHALTSPWNPYLPIMWWLVFLFGVWSLLCGDLPAAPVAVFAGSFCMQTHISYVGLVGALAVLGAAAVAWWILRRRRDPTARRRSIAFAASGAALGVVLWFPPLAEQLTGSQGGNLRTIARHFADPPEESFGFGKGLDFLLGSLNPWHLLTRPVIEGRPFLGGSTVPGTLLLVAWAAAVVVCWRLRHRTLLRLHLLLAVGLAAGAASTSRIFGAPWTYLTLWAWGLCAVLVLAVGWSAWALVAEVTPASLRPRLATAGAALTAALLVLVLVPFTADAAGVEPFPPEVSAAAAGFVPQVIAALEGAESEGGRGERYYVSWNDPRHQGSYGFTLFNELDRAGFDVGATEFLRSAVTRHRVRSPAEATAGIHLTTGTDIETWASKPEYTQIAVFAPFGPAGAAELERLRAEVTAELEATGRGELIDLVDDNPGGFALQLGLSEELQERVERIVELDVPIAVFTGPPVTEL